MKKLGITVPSVTEDEATELCAYHMRMAAAYFEAVPDDSNISLLNELTRICVDTTHGEFVAFKAFANALFAYHESLKEDD